jgi:hypothetical protein
MIFVVTILDTVVLEYCAPAHDWMLSCMSLAEIRSVYHQGVYLFLVHEIATVVCALPATTLLATFDDLASLPLTSPENRNSSEVTQNSKLTGPRNTIAAIETASRAKSRRFAKAREARRMG